MTDVTLAMTTIDCDDPRKLGRFYSELLGWDITHDSPEAVMVSGGGTSLGFGRIEGYQSPEWPDESGRKQFHLDMNVPDIDAAEARCVELGASVPEFQPGGERWRVLLDPAGHPFCLANWG